MFLICAQIILLHYLADINYFDDNNDIITNADNYYNYYHWYSRLINYNTSECISNAFAANSDKTSSVILEFPVIIYH